MNNEQLKEDIMQEILDGLGINVDIVSHDTYKDLKVELTYNGRVIASDYISNDLLESE